MIRRSTNRVDLADLMQKISMARKTSKVLLMKLWFVVFEGVFLVLAIHPTARLQLFLLFTEMIKRSINQIDLADLLQEIRFSRDTSSASLTVALQVKKGFNVSKQQLTHRWLHHTNKY